MITIGLAVDHGVFHENVVIYDVFYVVHDAVPMLYLLMFYAVLDAVPMLYFLIGPPRMRNIQRVGFIQEI